MMMMQKYGVTLHDLTLTHLTWRPERLHQTTSSPWRHAHDLLTSHVTQHAHAHLNVFPVSRVFMNVERTALHAFSQRHMTSSGDSTVNCVILILHVKITHCSTNCVNDYINIVVNRQLFVFSTSSVYSRLASSNFIYIFCKCRFLCQKLYVFNSFTAQHNNSLHANNRCCISLTSKRFYSTYSAY